MSEGEVAATAALVATFVALLKRHIPQVDGWVTLAVAAVLTAGATYLAADLGAPLRATIQSGIAVFIAATGGTAFLTKLAERSAPKTLTGGEVLVAGPASEGAQPKPDDIAKMQLGGGK